MASTRAPSTGNAPTAHCAGIRPSGSGWRACGPAGAPAVRRTGFGDGQEDTSTDQEHSGIFPLTARFPWITLAPQESRQQRQPSGPEGKHGASELWPVHTLWLPSWLLAFNTSSRSLGRHLPSSSTGDGSPRETRSPPPTRRPPRGAVGQWWSAVWHDVRLLSGHLRIASRPRKRTMLSVGR